MQMTLGHGTKHTIQLQVREASFRELCSKNSAKALLRMFHLSLNVLLNVIFNI